MSRLIDGPVSPCFFSVPLAGNVRFEALAASGGLSAGMAKAVEHAPRGESVAWGIPFQIQDPLLVQKESVTVPVEPFRAGWLVFLHTSDLRPVESGSDGLIVKDPEHGFPGEGRLNEHAADYVILYADGSQERAQVRRRHQVGAYTKRWGENCFQAVSAHKQLSMRAHHEQMTESWGRSQMRADSGDWAEWINWLWAWQNPHPGKEITGLRFEPAQGPLVISAVSAGDLDPVDGEAAPPMRWRTRRKAILRLPEGSTFDPHLDGDGLLTQIRLDLGQVITAHPRQVYPEVDWDRSYNNQLPLIKPNEVLIEYASHSNACFHLWDGRVVPVRQVEGGNVDPALVAVAPATQRVRLRVVERSGGRPVAVKLHIHGAAGEYLAPVDRHRIVNQAWFEDYSVDFAHRWNHQCSYITGDTEITLPLGRVYLEISKGFEIRPLRQVIEVGADTREVNIQVERVLPWRARGWVTADTHVHFLSPGSAMLEGAAEGVNVVNLLASQWGELMTNVGDFDGRSTWGAVETGGGPEENGEYLVRVGTENRQHVLGHISLLGYNGRIIAPMTTGGPDESALGDPVEVLLTEWARQCRAQGGLVVLPHFPNPRAEHAASIISGDIDALEMTSWGDLYSGISPYSLVDWYRYLNCGFRVAAVGGTDKMSADTAVGTVRAYARISDGQPFTYAAWMDAVRRAETFVTYGPLLEFSVGGQPMGSRIHLGHGGGTLDVAWQVASVTVPVERVDLIVNGEVIESAPLYPDGGQGAWSVKVERSSWLALLVRGHYPDQAPIIAAHSSPVMAEVEGSPFFAAADAVTILEQVEGALAFLDTLGTRAEDQAYRRMRLVLETAYRELHNRLHAAGHYHDHNPVTDHPEHH